MSDFMKLHFKLVLEFPLTTRKHPRFILELHLRVVLITPVIVVTLLLEIELSTAQSQT